MANTELYVAISVCTAPIYIYCMLYWQTERNCTRSSAIAETARVTISDSDKSANPNRNHEYDLCTFNSDNRVDVRPLRYHSLNIMTVIVAELY